MPEHIFQPNARGVVTAEQFLNALRGNEPTTIACATIQGDIEADGVTCSDRVIVRDSTFAGRLRLRDARFQRGLTIQGCECQHGIDLAGSSIDGSLSLAGTAVRRIPGADIAVQLQSLDISGNLFACALQCHGGLNLTATTVAGRADFGPDGESRTVIEGDAKFQHTEVEGQLSLLGIHVRGSILADRLAVGQEFYCASHDSHQCVIEGACRLCGGRFGGVVDLGGITTGQELSLQFATVQGMLFCRGAGGRTPRVGGPLRLIFATFLGPIDIEAAEINGDLDLHSATLRGGVRCSAGELQGDRPQEDSLCRIRGDFIIAQAECSGAVVLTGVVVSHNATFYGARITGDVSLRPESGHRTVIHEDCVFAQSTIRGSINLSGLRVQRDLDFQSAEISGPVTCAATGAYRTEIHGNVSCLNTRFGGQVEFSGAMIGNLELQCADIRGGLICSTSGSIATEITEQIVLRNATVTGSVELTGIRVGSGIVVLGGNINGDLDLEPREGFPVEVNGPVIVTGAVVLGQMSLAGSHIVGDVRVQSCEVTRGLFLGSEHGLRTRIDESLLIIGCHIGATADFGNVRIGNDMSAQRCQFDGNFRLGIEEQVRAEIGGTLSLHGSQVRDRFEMVACRIEGDCDLDDGVFETGVIIKNEGSLRTEVQGTVSLVGTRVRGGLHIVGCRITGCLNLLGATIEGELFCPPDGNVNTEVVGRVMIYHTSVSGRATLDGMMIGDGLLCSHSKIDGPISCTAEGIGNYTITRVASFYECKTADIVLDGSAIQNGSLELLGTECRALRLNGTWPQEAELDRFRFESLALPGDDFVRFLNLNSDVPRSTYLFTEKWLRELGRSALANRVYRDLRSRERRRMAWWGLEWVWDGIQDIFVGYGTTSWRLFAVLAAVFCFSWVLFSKPESVERTLTLTGGKKDVGIADRKLREEPAKWSSVDAAWVAGRIAFPMMVIPPDDEWKPSSNNIKCGQLVYWVTYDTYAFWASLLCWMAGPLYVAALLGFFKRRE